MHAWRVNNEVYVQTRRDDLLRQAGRERLAATSELPRRPAARLVYVSGAVLYRVGSQLAHLGRKLQGMLPDTGADVADIRVDVVLAGRPGKEPR
jgi:hypothetical protein